MSLVIDENEIEALPITIDPEVLSGMPVFRGTVLVSQRMKSSHRNLMALFV